MTVDLSERMLCVFKAFFENHEFIIFRQRPLPSCCHVTCINHILVSFDIKWRQHLRTAPIEDSQEKPYSRWRSATAFRKEYLWECSRVLSLRNCSVEVRSISAVALHSGRKLRAEGRKGSDSTVNISGVPNRNLNTSSRTKPTRLIPVILRGH
jgi:hypothetical protein